MKHPLGQLSRKVASSIERGPAFDAMFTRTKVIPTTWGDLASRLVEADVIEPTPDAVCDFLNIDRNQLVDPEIIFTTQWEVTQFSNQMHGRWVNEYQQSFSKHLKAFGDFMKQAEEGWTVENGEDKWRKIQEQIDNVDKEEYSVKNPKRVLGLRTRIYLLCLERDAYYSGKAVTLDEFVATVLGYDGDSPFTVVEIAAAVDGVIKHLLMDPLFEDEDVNLRDMVIGNDQFGIFAMYLRDFFSSRAHKYAQSRWNAISHFFIAPDYRSHSLFREPPQKTRPFSIFDLYTPEYVEEIREAHRFTEEFDRQQKLNPPDPEEVAQRNREMLENFWTTLEQGLGIKTESDSEES